VVLAGLLVPRLTPSFRSRWRRPPWWLLSEARRLLDHAAPAALAAIVGADTANGASLPEMASRVPGCSLSLVTAAVA